ncbi:hypothetical protein EZJ19_13725 [Parasulfuritortus cantonensis]|uniref:Uncharacterized protein n=1 Tax=Parasulfuritortus cantonensis TaxID=2528202 RepID=A0A4R1B1I5_9PROT|nr:hypothetical protein [Parasulfuritortus cantonensis]TCJ11864.1 hypothetical protein EZJ19_13725 [Parasulfuritortus cantonensis]
MQTRDREAQAHAPEAQARDREVQVREREVQAREHKAQVREREPAPRDFHDEGGAMFSDRDVAAIRDYYRQGHQPGMTAGRIIKLRQGEAYPFGYTWVSLPRDLEARLSPLPKGYIRVLVGTDIGILDIRTRVVVDLLENLAG